MGRETHYFDALTVLLFIFLSSVGLFVISTISRELFLAQVSFVVVGLFFLWIFSRLDKELLWWFSPWAYILSIVFLSLSYLGPEIRGATRWIVIGSLQIQPSEMVKPLLLLAFSRFVSQYSPRNLKYLFIHVFLFAIPWYLVLAQPDLGTSIVYLSSWIAMLVAGGLPLGLLIMGGIGTGFAFPLLWNSLASYQKLRILTFIEPSLDPKGAGYNAIQSMIAVGSGQVFGRGLGRGTQSHLRFLPEHHTDFIFATLSEELGFLGGLILLGAYFGILTRILMPLFRGVMNDLFSFVYSLGLFTMILSQVFINVGMNIGIVPITGITLPLVSYGGSSLLSFAISFGIWFALQKKAGAWGIVANRRLD